MSRGNLVFDLGSAEFAADPFPLFTRLRELGGLSRATTGWVASRHADVVELLTDDRVTSRGPGIDAVAARNPIMGSLLAMDPPAHTRVRAVVAHHFTPRAIDAFAPTARRIVAEHAARLGEASGAVELMEDFARPVTTSVISEFVGVPAYFRAEFADATSLALRDQHEHLVELSRHLMHEPHGHVQRDIAAAVDQQIASEEAVGLLGLLLFAGHETTTALIGNAIVLLSARSDLRDALVSDRSLVRPFVDELLRVASPVQHIGRWAAHDFDFGCAPVERGDVIVLLPGSANRDETVWPEPAEVAFQRGRAAPHVAFGWGRHYCLGAALARTEAELAVVALLTSVPDFTLLEPVTYREPANVRCPNRLVVKSAD